MSNSVKRCLTLKLEDLKVSPMNWATRTFSVEAEDEGGSGDSEFRLHFSRNLAVKGRDGMIEWDVKRFEYLGS